MLELRRRTFAKIQKYLLRRQKEVDAQLESIAVNDPVSGANLVAEASEPGTESWLAEAHGRLTTVKNDLMDLSSRIKTSLINMRKGTYGKCENCGKQIETERLEAMPTATLCVACSKNTNNQKQNKKKTSKN